MNLSLTLKYQLALILACISTVSLGDHITQTDSFDWTSIACSIKYESGPPNGTFLEQRIKPSQDRHLEVQ